MSRIDEIKAQESRARQKIAEECAKAYERYCNPSAKECLLPSHKGTGKVYDRMIFAELFWGFKAIKLLKSNAIDVPSDIPLSSVAEDITKLLAGTDLKVHNAKISSKNQSACTCALWNAKWGIERALDEIKSLSLAMFGRENNRISWEQMLPEISGWGPEPEPEPETEPEPEPEPNPKPNPHYYPNTYRFQAVDYDEPNHYEYEDHVHDEPDHYEYEDHDYDQPDHYEYEDPDYDEPDSYEFEDHDYD